eukprot:5566722-Ditylum_brightwellii.AAC.1
MAESYKLENWRVKEFLTDIKAENTPFHGIRLINICNRNIKLYGLPYNRSEPNNKQGQICRAI